MDEAARESQLGMARDLLSLADAMGYGEAEFEITRGGTVRMKVRKDGAQAKTPWETGRKRRP